MSKSTKGKLNDKPAKQKAVGRAARQQADQASDQADASLGHSQNPAELKRQALAELLPEAFSEGQLDIEALKRALGEAVVAGGERYRLDWAGKSEAYKVLQTPSTATLRPQREQSISFDTAQHVFIEGENLEVLKVLQKAYFGKVKLIYIDPPYNTGNDSFIYPDRFQESKEDYLKRINELEDDGTLMREGFFRKNSRENGHYHSNWLNMMLPRLYIARNLLREDGVIFISCDDNEVHNLRCLMNEVFGEENFVSIIVIQSNKRGQTYKDISKTHEYLVVFGKSQEVSLNELPKDSEALPYEDSAGRFDLWELRNRNPKFGRHNRPNLFYPIFLNPKLVDANGCCPVSLEESMTHTVAVYPRNSEGVDGCWRWGKEKVLKQTNRKENPAVVAKQRRDGGWNIYEKSRKGTTKAKSLWDETEVISEQGTVQLGELGLGKMFDHPKPRDLVAKVIKIASDDGDIVFDFFAGSSTTADALFRVNLEEETNRKFVLVQLPELLGEEAANETGYKTIAELSRERINRVVKALRPEPLNHANKAEELGFRSFELSPSNFKQWRGDEIESAEALAEQMQMFVQSEKDGAQTEDILYELMLKFGQELTTPIEKLEIQGQDIYAIRDQTLLFVLNDFTEEMIGPLVALKPHEIIALDSVFHDSDELKTNLDLQCRDAGIRLTCL